MNKALAFALVLMSLPVMALARPTGAPLFTFPLEPCRVLDTRVSLGPLAGGFGMDVHVRGSNLIASEGAAVSDCGVPSSAEAAIVNVTVIQPSASGYLKVSGYGTVAGLYGPYSRLTYRSGENDSNEMLVTLCNVYIYPNPQQACGSSNGSTSTSTYNDFQVLNMGPSGSSLHLVIDVVGYLERP